MGPYVASSYLREVLNSTWINSPDTSCASWHDADEKTSKITTGLRISFLWETKKEGRQQKCSQNTSFPGVDWTVWNSASPRMYSIPKPSEKHAAAVRVLPVISVKARQRNSISHFLTLWNKVTMISDKLNIIILCFFKSLQSLRYWN